MFTFRLSQSGPQVDIGGTIHGHLTPLEYWITARYDIVRDLLCVYCFVSLLRGENKPMGRETYTHTSTHTYRATCVCACVVKLVDSRGFIVAFHLMNSSCVKNDANPSTLSMRRRMRTRAGCVVPLCLGGGAVCQLCMGQYGLTESVAATETPYQQSNG